MGPFLILFGGWLTVVSIGRWLWTRSDATALCSAAGVLCWAAGLALI